MHGCYDYHRPPQGGDPTLIYPIEAEHPVMVRPPPEEDLLLGDLDSSGYSLTSLDTIARSMDRGRPTEV
jgi:hypothetical protein